MREKRIVDIDLSLIALFRKLIEDIKKKKKIKILMKRSQIVCKCVYSYYCNVATNTQRYIQRGFSYMLRKHDRRSSVIRGISADPLFRVRINS